MTGVPTFITLGSNIEPQRNLKEAVRLLGEHTLLRAISRVYESAPLDAAGRVMAQGNFLNAAVLIETGLPPLTLKYEVLRPIEARLGRLRTMDKFAARPIDLDIVLYGDLILDDERLTLPDPDILRRAHVALPLADLAPDFVHPVTRQTLAGIAAGFMVTPGVTILPWSWT